VPHLRQELYRKAAEALGEQLHTLRPLVMEDVEASGVDASISALTGNRHRVNLVYASAVPVGTYVNVPMDDAHEQGMLAVAEMLLFAQYYGALKHAARKPLESGRRKVYLMPLGGGVFGNPFEVIVRAISNAVDALTELERDALDISVLTFHRSRGDEAGQVRRLLEHHGKFRDEFMLSI